MFKIKLIFLFPIALSLFSCLDVDLDVYLNKSGSGYAYMDISIYEDLLKTFDINVNETKDYSINYFMQKYPPTDLHLRKRDTSLLKTQKEIIDIFEANIKRIHGLELDKQYTKIVSQDGITHIYYKVKFNSLLDISSIFNLDGVQDIKYKSSKNYLELDLNFLKKDWDVFSVIKYNPQYLEFIESLSEENMSTWIKTFFRGRRLNLKITGVYPVASSNFGYVDSSSYDSSKTLKVSVEIDKELFSGNDKLLYVKWGRWP